MNLAEGDVDQQRAKEFACLLALRRGMALFSRGHLVYGVFADGHEVPICGSRQPAELWGKTARVLVRDGVQNGTPSATYRIWTPGGVYAASTWWRLLWNWVVGERTHAAPTDGER